jgi:polyadenylate-binding protein
MAAPAPAHVAQNRPQATALFVGDLHPSVTEHILWAAFADAGLIRNVRVCQDNNTKRSLGYGYVNFVNAADAERALDTKANMRIMDRPCRVMWAQRDPALRRSGVGNLFVKNLASTVDQRKLHNAFSLYGNILSCKLMMDDKGASKGFGFVHFESPESAAKATVGLNETELDGQRIYVGPHVPKKSRISQADTKWTNVFVKNMPGDFDEVKLKELFSKFGAITSAFITKHEFSAKTAGSTATPTAGDVAMRSFGFVNFASHEEAVKAVEEMNDFKLGDHTLYVSRAQTRTERSASLARTVKREPVQSNLYIKHLEEGVTKEQLEKHFSKFGTITSASLAVDANGASRGFGYVCFATAEAAQKAIADASNHAIPGFTKPLYVSLFEPKTVRGPRISAQKAMQQHQQMFFSPQMPPYYYNQGRPMNQPPRGPRTGGPHAAAGAPGPRRAQGPAHLPHPGQNVPPVAVAPAAAAPARAPLSLPPKDALSAMAPAEAQTAIGDYLFNSMLAKYPQRNGKITGMLLSMHAADLQGLIDLVHNPAELEKHINEANDILDESPQ